MLIFVIILTVFTLISYKLLTGKYSYWKNIDVPHPPVSLFFGNLLEAVLLKKNVAQIYTDIYKTFNDIPYVGFYKLLRPGIIIRDPEIIKDVLVKDFDSFHDNDVEIDDEIDPLGGKNPFFLRGNKWKVTRGQLAPCFSSGKMKMVFPHMVEVSKQLVSYLDKECVAQKGCLEAKELIEKYTIDNLASCAFGLNGRSFEDPNAEFRSVGTKMLELTLSRTLKLLCIFSFPPLTKILKITFITEEAARYFRNLVKNTLKYRQENNVVRDDFLDIMNQLKEKPSEYGFTDVDVTAHTMSFFFNGFESSSITMSFILYDLATNGDVQQNLRTEINTTLTKYEGIMTYEAIKDMKYLDSIISESLRLHPPAIAFQKSCTTAYQLPPLKPNGKPKIIERNMPVIIPVYGLHLDEKYFPEPERFNPDRFSHENKPNITKGAYLPFGDGPRKCLGQRFALLQVKVAIGSIVQNFDIRLNEKTIVPLEINPRYFLMTARGGIWLDFSRRL